MNYTEQLFAKSYEYQNARKAINTEYKDKLRGLNKYKGSKGYDDELMSLTEEHDKKLSELRKKYFESADFCIDRMRKNIIKRPITPPKSENLEIVKAMQMRKELTEEEFDRAANSLKDDPMSTELLNDLAHERGILKSYRCTEMSNKRAYSLVDSILEYVKDFGWYSTGKAARLTRKWHDEKYGAADDSELPDREEFSNIYEFYRMGDELEQFEHIVND